MGKKLKLNRDVSGLLPQWGKAIIDECCNMIQKQTLTSVIYFTLNDTPVGHCMINYYDKYFNIEVVPPKEEIQKFKNVTWIRTEYILYNDTNGDPSDKLLYWDFKESVWVNFLQKRFKHSKEEWEKIKAAKRKAAKNTKRKMPLTAAPRLITK